MRNIIKKVKGNLQKRAKLFADHISEKSLVSRIYEELRCDSKKTNSLVKKGQSTLNRYFSKDLQMANKHMKRCSTSLVIQFSSVQSLSRVQLFATPWTAACQASLPITNSQNCHPTVLSSVIHSLPAFSLSQHQGLFQYESSY